MNNKTKRRWEIEKIIEDNILCPICKQNTLIGTNPFENVFLCSNCGNIFYESDIKKHMQDKKSEK